MSGAALYPLLCAAAYYLGAQAVITRFLWSRYPSSVDSLMTCASCSGFWYGIGAGYLGRVLDIPFLGLDPGAWHTPLIVGFCAIVWTPVVSWLHLAALAAIGGGDVSEAE